MAKHSFDFDLVTLGAGSGGTRASRFSAQKYGAKVAVVELPFGFVSSDEVGGAGGQYTCKALWQPALLLFSTWLQLYPTPATIRLQGTLKSRLPAFSEPNSAVLDMCRNLCHQRLCTFCS